MGVMGEPEHDTYAYVAAAVRDSRSARAWQEFTHLTYRLDRLERELTEAKAEIERLRAFATMADRTNAELHDVIRTAIRGDGR